MPFYTITALEKFLVETVYEDVFAKTPEEAEAIVRKGDAAYDRHSIQEGEEEFIEVLDIEATTDESEDEDEDED